MIEDIDKLVNTEFLGEMELKSLPNSKPFSQKEAIEMQNILGKVYSISHGITCRSCGAVYKK